MSDNFKWVISHIERTTDVRHLVTAIHWRYQLQKGNAVVDEYGDYPMPPQSLMHADGATKSDYVSVLEDAIDFPSLQERLRKRMHTVLHPMTELIPGPVA